MAEEQDKATAGKVVSIHYKLTVGDGQVIDESGDKPLSYLHGTGSIVPGLERKIEGQEPGTKFQAVITPEEGYGPRHPEGQKALPRQAFPDDAEVKPGMQFGAQGPDGKVIPLWVLEVKKEEVVVDLNHPLAGETLNFDVEVVDVREPTAEEQQHGHAHGAGGAHP